MMQMRAAERREEIIRAAAAEFDEAGYAAASLSSIAARLGRTKGAMSYHFSSKALLAREVAIGQYRQWDPVLERLTGDGYGGIDAMIVLSFVVTSRFRDDVLVRAGIRLQHDAGLTGVDLPVPFQGWIDIVAKLLSEPGPGVSIPSGLDAVSAAEVIVEGFTGLQQVAHRISRAADIAARVRRYWLLVLPGLGIADARDRIARLEKVSKAY